MSPTWATFLFEAANFLLLAALLGWLLFRPVRDALERRRAALEAEERAAAEKRGEAERALAGATAQRRELESSLAGLRERAHQDAERERARLLDSAREQAQRERQALEGELDALRRSQAQTLVRDAAAAAREIVVRLLARIDAPELERALLDSARRELAALAAAGPLGEVIVESAAPLAAETLARLLEAAHVTAGDASQRVVPELQCGLRVLTARGLVDVSIAGLAEHAERALVERLATKSSAHV